MTERIAFIGFGEAGQTISRGLLGDKKPAIRSYDILFGQSAGAPLEAAARALGVETAPSWCARSARRWASESASPAR
jgi:pyrroline-5-carboxylate reductase